MFKFYFILEYFKLSTCWVQSDVFGVKSEGQQDQANQAIQAGNFEKPRMSLIKLPSSLIPGYPKNNSNGFQPLDQGKKRTIIIN